MAGLEKYEKRKAVRLLPVALSVCAVAFTVVTTCYFYNNVSLRSDERFSDDLDRAAKHASGWAAAHESDLLGRLGYVNVALLRMLQDCDQLHSTYVFSNMLDKYMARPTTPEFKKNILDANRPIDVKEINEVFEKLIIDYQWETYALAPEKTATSADALDFFNPDRWQGRQLTHQLWALVLYRERQPCGEEIDRLIEHLCDRLAGELSRDFCVVDIYIQKVAFILKAGHPEKIRQRWVERIIANQNADGGWDDRWFCFTSDRRPQFGHVSSDPHASIQALWVLYQVKYRYPELFDVQADSD